MRDSCKGIPLNGTPEHLRDVVAYFAEQLGFEVVYEELVPQEEQNNKEKKKEWWETIRLLWERAVFFI